MRGVAELQDNVVDSVRHIWLAGLGAAILAQEEGSKAYERLIKKGEEIEQRGGSPVTKVKAQFDEATKKASGTWDTFMQKFDEQVAASLHRIGVPTRDEIATLTRRVDALIASVDKLRVKTSSRADLADDEAIIIKA
jgi:poly(hydroxyalkanoate) granule-associated protein